MGRSPVPLSHLKLHSQQEFHINRNPLEHEHNWQDDSCFWYSYWSPKKSDFSDFRVTTTLVSRLADVKRGKFPREWLGKVYGALAQLVERRSTYSPPRTAKRPLPRPQWTMENLVGNLTKWGISTAGSALHSHCRGQRFESAMLHHPQSLEITGFQGFFDAQIQDGNICHICSLWFEFWPDNVKTGEALFTHPHVTYITILKGNHIDFFLVGCPKNRIRILLEITYFSGM